MLLSTTEQYDPYENAVAERINGILKYEFGLIKTIPSIEVASKMVKQTIEVYQLQIKKLYPQTANGNHLKIEERRLVDKIVERPKEEEVKICRNLSHSKPPTRRS
jgi:hypothetical protein